MSVIAVQQKLGLEGSLIATGRTSTYRDIAIYRDEMPSKQYFMETLISSVQYPVGDEYCDLLELI
jgi:hypothetical protein